ncbi:hypothetical protein BECAL_02778 [Bellilinea caldifistulae]|nr:hypothetical protein BECAL_02778 [Bellilinea caldifistulae]
MRFIQAIIYLFYQYFDYIPLCQKVNLENCKLQLKAFLNSSSLNFLNGR